MEVWHTKDWKEVKEAASLGKAEEMIKNILDTAKQNHTSRH
jgi:hypothetical protein